MSKNCITHSFACDCREAQFAKLAKRAEAMQRVVDAARTVTEYAMLPDNGGFYITLRLLKDALDALGKGE